MQVSHYFIFNPAAGARDARSRLMAQLDKLSPVPYTLFITNEPGDGTKLVREVCERESGPLRFYACGGDGTLAEVAQGALGYPNAAIGVWPCGSGNDYTRLYGGEERFINLTEQVNAPSILVDLIKVNGRISINVVNIGLEAQAAATMLKFRHTPLLGGKRAYLMGILDAVTSHLKTRCSIHLDDALFYEGEMLTASFASGQYIGGGFHIAPKAVNDDGLMDVCAILPFSRLTLIKLLGIYKKGGHFESPAFEYRFVYKRGSRASIHFEQETALCLDGEIIKDKHFELQMLPRAIRFILPPQAGQTPDL